MRVRISSFLTTLLLLVPIWVGGLPGTVSAHDKGNMGTMTPTSGPLVAEVDPSDLTVYGNRSEDSQTFAFFRPPTCRQVSYCNTHAFQVEVPSGYLEIWIVRVTLEWEGLADNQLTLHVWADQGCCFGAPVAGCRRPTTCGDPENYYGGEAGYGSPMVASMTEPTGNFWITVLNWEGVNTKYKITLEWLTEDLPPLPDFSPPSSGGSGGFGSGGFGSGGSDSGTTGGFTTDGGDEPDVETTTIRVPGPDGELIEMELPVYTRAAGVEVEGGIPLLIPITVALLLLAASAGGFFFFRARRRGEEDELATPTGFHY